MKKKVKQPKPTFKTPGVDAKVALANNYVPLNVNTQQDAVLMADPSADGGVYGGANMNQIPSVIKDRPTKTYRIDFDMPPEEMIEITPAPVNAAPDVPTAPNRDADYNPVYDPAINDPYFPIGQEIDTKGAEQYPVDVEQPIPRPMSPILTDRDFGQYVPTIDLEMPPGGGSAGSGGNSETAQDVAQDTPAPEGFNWWWLVIIAAALLVSYFIFKNK